MRYRRLGDSGLMVSVVGIGCNNFGGRIDAARAAEVVHAALDHGVTLFDTADVYGNPSGASEQALGAALGKRRDEAIIATKFGANTDGENGPDWGARGGRRYLVQAVEASLRRLGTDYIDLYQIHTPDAGTPIEETLATLDDLVRAGKVRYLGHSNFAGWQITDAAWTARTRGFTPFVSAQNRYSLVDRTVEAEVIPACLKFGVGMLPYFPLESGLLTGKYRQGAPPPDGTRLSGERFAPRLAGAPWEKIQKLEEFATERDLSLLTIAIGGLAAKPAVASVIAGATSAEQVAANVAAGEWQPTAEDLETINTITA
jgi:aryl-alcohol dehydrogenase-like predicted oxidoreductase